MFNKFTVYCLSIFVSGTIINAIPIYGPFWFGLCIATGIGVGVFAEYCDKMERLLAKPAREPYSK